MGIKLTIYSENEGNNIYLTNHTIKKYGKNLDEPDGKNEYLSGPILGIEFSGKVDVYDSSGEILELKKLAEWAKRTAHEKDVYRKAVIEFNDISGSEYDSITLKKTFVVKYEQSFDGEKGEGEFYILLRSLDHIDDVFGQSWSSGNTFIIPDTEIPLASPLSNTINTEYTIGPKTPPEEEYQEHLKGLTLNQLKALQASLVLSKAIGKNTDKNTELSLQEKMEMVSSEIRKKSKKNVQEKDFINKDLYEKDKWYKIHADYIVQIEPILDEKTIQTLNKIKQTYQKNIDIYKEISSINNLPTELIAAIHYRENASDYFNSTFDIYLHNGQELGYITTIVPADKFFKKGEFVAAAVDALKGELNVQTGLYYLENRKNQLSLSSNTTDIIAMVTFAVYFNGTGGSSINGKTSYAYNGTNIFDGGLYTSDGNYDPNATDQNLGVYRVLEILLK